jgi:PAS domain S-box-containing protein
MWGIPETFAHSAADEELTRYVAGQLKDPAAFVDATRRLYREPEAKTHDVLELADGRVFERHSEPRRVKGKCVGRVWGYRDVTELKKTEQRLRSLSAAVEQSPVSIVITDLDGNIEYVNPKFTAITGYTFEEVLGRNSRILKSGETSEEEYRKLWETIKSAAAWKGTFHNRKKNGELYWVSATICAIHDASGAPTHYLAVKEDITQQRLASEALQKSEGRYRGLVEHLLEGFVYSQMVFENGKAADFIYLGVNGAFETLTGLKDVVGKRATEIYPGIRESDPGFLEVHGRVVQTGKPERLETYVAAMRRWLSISLYSPEKGYFCAVFDVITERKRAEEALRESEANFRELFDCAPVGYHELDKDGMVRRVNRAECALLGYESGEMLGRPVWNFIAGADREASREVFRRKLSGELPLEPYQRRYVRRGGGELWIEIHDILVRNATGETVGMRTALLDITERRQAEDALRTSQERFRIAAENASDVVFEFDLDTGRLQFFGDRVQERFPKLTFPETLAEWFPMLHADDLEKTGAAVRRHVATREPVEVECRMPQSDGSILYAEIRAAISRDPISGREKSIGVIRDVTLRKAAEQANAELAAIIKSTDAAIVRKDASGRILTWNSGAERMYGYRATEMIGRTTFALLPPDRVKELEAIEASLALGSEVDHLETARITKAGQRLDVMLTASPIRDDAGHVVGSAHIAWNITARKRLEWQLAQSQKLESIGQLAAGIAHEINTPIQYIGDNAKFLSDAFQDLFRVIGRQGRQAGPQPGGNGSAATALECPPEDVDVDYLRQEVPVAIGQLEEGVAHVARIVRAMKEFSHPGPVEKICVDINRALDSTILVSRNEWKYVAEMQSEFDPELPPVPCVPGEMNQVFLNLIVNAAHAVGDVVRDTGRKGVIAVGTRRNGDWAEIRIRDTGAGIPDEIRTKVFDPFFTTKEVGKGTGQGLSIAHAVVVQKHQGSIDFESRVGAGTTFLIRLPLDT